MRVEPYGPGSIVHIIKRGARGMEIVRDKDDRERFLDTLFYLNDTYQNCNWGRDRLLVERFTRPVYWPEPDPLVDILAWTLLNNHVHILVQVREEHEHGIYTFTQRVFRSMTGYFNEKYHEKGSIFQGPYKGVTITSDVQLRYVIPYVMFKNTLEMHPDGFDSISKNLDAAWQWAIEYPYSSIGAYVHTRNSMLVAPHSSIHDMFPTERELKRVSCDMLLAYKERRYNDLDLILES